MWPDLAGHPFLTRQPVVETGLGLFKPIVKQLLFYQKSAEIWHTDLRYPREKEQAVKTGPALFTAIVKQLFFYQQSKPAKNIGVHQR